MAPVNIRPAREGDLSAVVAVMNAVDVATLGEPDTTEADIAAGWAESEFDLSRDALVAEQGDAVVGYAETYDRGEGDGPHIVDLDVFVDPASDEKVASALLDAALPHAEAVAGAGGVLATWLPRDDPRAALFAARGFAPSRQFLRMRFDLDGPIGAVPEVPGIRFAAVRPGEDEAAVHAVLADAFAKHVRPMTPSLDVFVEHHVNHPDFDASLWLLAWDGETAVGAMTLFDHGDLGFIRHVGVRNTHRGRGIAGALILRGLQMLAERNRPHVDLGVDFDDEVGAAALYERLGFRTLQQLELVERRL